MNTLKWNNILCGDNNIIVFVFYVFYSKINDNDEREPPFDNHFLFSKKDFNSMINLSLLTYLDVDGYFCATVNRSAGIIKNKRIRKCNSEQNIPLINGAESIEHVKNNIFSLIDEEHSFLYTVLLAGKIGFNVESNVQLGVFRKKKRGFEGIGWQENREIRFAAKEWKLAKIYTYKVMPRGEG
ncbi:SdiA-regulated domain-containing protein [Escherichia coli]|uniref:SdiA-regulated domain-containing protein n=1 Tax=Escherichia coli TaxID=562 RepID=UPI001593FC6C|nr:SdiA-regulated domain-containing protein [Escherichia coli]